MQPLTLVKDILRSGRREYENRQRARQYTSIHGNLDLDLHIREAAQWLCRAQDAGSDRGFSYGADLGGSFLPSYPETTGYIIPTILRLADHFGDPSYVKRAVEAGVWEVDVQLPSGAVRAGKFNPNDPKPDPAIFNTGQVLIGWSALLRQNHSQKVANAAKRAADWMLEMQEPDGNWIRGNSTHADPKATLYNVKAAWGLCAFGLAANYPAAVEGALRNGEYTLRNQLPNGWYIGCCLEDAARPLLHTIAYTMQGLIGMARLVNREDFIAGVRRTADSLIKLMASDGFIPGRIDSSFHGAVDWCCLTGSAQTGEVCGQLFHLTGEPRYRDALHHLNRYIMARHDISNTNPAIRGGLAGSWPVGGDYGRFKVLNWAAKFFLDSMLEEKAIKG